MEAAGLSIGIAALFTSCVQCFEYFKAATTLREDFEILLLKLEIEQERFLVWGEDAGIGTDGWEEQSLFNGDSKRQDLVRRCLDAIRRLLENAEDLKSQYGVRSTAPVTRSTTPPQHKLQRFEAFSSPIWSIPGQADNSPKDQMGDPRRCKVRKAHRTSPRFDQ